MRILIAVASKHGGTRGIADEIGAELNNRGLETEVVPMSAQPDPAGYDAVIAGSAVYMGKWMDEAKRFVEHHRSALAERKVWLFASGPIPTGDDKPAAESGDTAKYAAMVGAVGFRTFDGRLAPAELGLGERLVIKAVHAPAGDFRDWDQIRAWAGEIAGQMEG